MKIKNLLELDLEDIILHMKAHGLETLSANGVTLTLSNSHAPVKAELPPSQFENELEKEKLPCGHSVWEANELDECLHGCIQSNVKEE